MTNNTIKGLAIILNYIKNGNADKPFYASDLGLNGAQIQCLRFGDSDDFQFIVPTGNIKEIFIDTGYNNNYKKVSVKEWKVNIHHWAYGADEFYRQLSETINKRKEEASVMLNAYTLISEILEDFQK